jgi:hypothetical protein
MPTHVVRTNSAGEVALLPQGASHVTRVHVYNPNATGSVTGTVNFYDQTLSTPYLKFTADATSPAVLELGLDLDPATQTLTVFLDSAPTTQLACFTTYR